MRVGPCNGVGHDAGVNRDSILILKRDLTTRPVGARRAEQENTLTRARPSGRRHPLTASVTRQIAATTAGCCRYAVRTFWRLVTRTRLNEFITIAIQETALISCSLSVTDTRS